MASSHAPVVIAIVGPTASGKSAVAEELALQLGTGGVVSADSMQVYRGMDIGTAKTPPESRRVPLFCVDLVDPCETYSVSQFAETSRWQIDQSLSRSGAAVVCGGTGLYLRAALEEMDYPKGDQIDNPVRERYQQLADEIGPLRLHEMLRQVDPQSADLIHPNNVRRVIRAFEMREQGVAYHEQNATLHERVYRHPTRIFGLTMSRDSLYARIDARVDQMMEEGLLLEVATLYLAGAASSPTAGQAIGYKEVFRLFDSLPGSRVDQTPDDLLGRLSAEQVALAVASVKQGTRRFAKRQLTWFRSVPNLVWIDMGEYDAPAAAQAVLDNLDRVDVTQECQV